MNPIDLEALQAALAVLTRAIAVANTYRLHGESRKLSIVTLRMDAAEPLQRAVSETLTELTARRARDAEVEALVAAGRELISAFDGPNGAGRACNLQLAVESTRSALANLTGAKP